MRGDVLVAETLWPFYSAAALQPHISLDEWKRLPQGTPGLGAPNDAAAASVRAEREKLMRAVPLGAMRSYVPGSIWSKILAGDAQWIVSQSEVCAWLVDQPVPQ